MSVAPILLSSEEEKMKNLSPGMHLIMSGSETCIYMPYKPD